MFCSNCGKELADGSKFCSGCGTKVGEAGSTGSVSSGKKGVELSPAALSFYKKGEEYFKQNDFDNAILAFGKALKQQPDFVDAYKGRAIALNSVEEYGRAIKNLNKAIDLDPNNATLYYLRGLSYCSRDEEDEDFEQAIMDFDVSLKINPDYLDAYKAVISVYKSKNDYEQIIKNTNDAIKLSPTDYSLYVSRGEAYYLIKSIDNALGDFNKVLEKEPNNVEGLSYRGRILFEKGEYDKSLVDINHILNVSPNNEDSLFMRSKIYFEKNNYEKALADIDEVVKRKEEREECTLDIYVFQAETHYKSGLYETNPSSIMEDYLKLWNIESDDEDKNKEKRAKELGFFKDIMVERYKKAIASYNQEKDLFLLYNYKRSNRAKNDYYHMDIRSTVLEPKTIYKEPMIFFNESFSNDYCKLIDLNKRKDEYEGFLSHKNEDAKIEPKYWIIVHAYTGEVYLPNGSSKEHYNQKWLTVFSCENDGVEYKYNSLEEAFEDYKRIIRDEYLCRTYFCDNPNLHTINLSRRIDDKTIFEFFGWGEGHFGWQGGSVKGRDENNFMDLFIVGSK
jgi:tetratricopeptide (TPR) repeat protein